MIPEEKNKKSRKDLCNWKKSRTFVTKYINSNMNFNLKRIKRVILPSLLLIAASPTVSARDFFDTSVPASSDVFSLGLRVGVNTSNRNIGKDVYNLWNKNSWGTGFDLGVVADINIRDYIALQPGVFFQTRSGNHTYINTVPGEFATVDGNKLVQVGNYRSYSLSIPVICSVRFNISDDVRWSVDLGPYVQLTMKNDFDNTVWFPEDYQSGVKVEPRSVDVGVKMGSGLNIKEHYYVGIHYWAGAMNTWKDGALGGRNKAWSFTVGYDF